MSECAPLQGQVTPFDAANGWIGYEQTAFADLEPVNYFELHVNTPTERAAIVGFCERAWETADTSHPLITDDTLQLAEGELVLTDPGHQQVLVVRSNRHSWTLDWYQPGQEDKKVHINLAKDESLTDKQSPNVTIDKHTPDSAFGRTIGYQEPLIRLKVLEQLLRVEWKIGEFRLRLVNGHSNSRYIEDDIIHNATTISVGSNKI